MLDYKKTGTFLASKRKQAQMTQADVAQKLGVSFQSVSKWENGTIEFPEIPHPVLVLWNFFRNLLDCLGLQWMKFWQERKKQKHPILTARRESTFLIQMQ